MDALLLAMRKADAPFQIFNLGTNEYCTVNDSIGWICGHLGLKPELEYTGGTRGWIGDNPFIFLDCARIRALGWVPRLTIRQGVVKTLRYLETNQHLLEAAA
jgi:UDP-glucose 4-epimerase